MDIKKFREILSNNLESNINWILPGSVFVPEHYHITEIGHVKKNFFDCGGTARSTESCVLQIWVANDTQHRLNTNKLLKIVESSSSIISDDLPVEVEYEEYDTISNFILNSSELSPRGVIFYLASKHTNCLAPDKCKVNSCSSSCC